MIQYLRCTRDYMRAKMGLAIREEVGGGEIVAVVLIIVAVIALGILFSGQLNELFNDLWEKVTGTASSVPTEMTGE